MPNWVVNRLTITGDNAKEKMSQHFITTDEGLEFDFNTLIPMPEEIRTSGDAWYDWSIQNWGTKWNACHTDYNESDSGCDLWFDTAWSEVPLVVAKLAEMHRDLRILYDYAEEQAGYHSGGYLFEEGEPQAYIENEPYSKKAYEQYFELWGDDDDFVFNPKLGTYEYHER